MQNQGQRPMRPQGQRPPQNDGLWDMKKLAVILGIVAAVIVLIGVLVGVVVALASGKDNDTDRDNDGGNQGGYEQNDRPSVSKPLDGVKTNPSRTSYQIGQSSDFEYIEGISSEAAILVDLDNFQMVAGIEFDRRICPASMTKVMTVLIACENLKYLSDTLTVSQDAVNYQATHGASGFGLSAGDTLTVQDLLYLIYYRSDTVACLMISEYIAGSEAEFVKMMNKKATDMGLTNTHFSNSTGLQFEGEEYYTTCRDMAAIMAYALENTLANRILTSTGTYYLQSGQYKGSALGPGWKADAGRLGTDEVAGVRVMGGKTGYETVSGSCLVTYAQSVSGGKKYIQVIVGGSGTTNAICTKDVKHIYTNYAN